MITSPLNENLITQGLDSDTKLIVVSVDEESKTQIENLETEDFCSIRDSGDLAGCVDAIASSICTGLSSIYFLLNFH